MAVSVAELCKQKALNVSALAAGTGLDPSRLVAILEGRWTPSPQERERIASVLDVPTGEIAWGHKIPIQHLYGHGPG